MPRASLFPNASSFDLTSAHLSRFWAVRTPSGNSAAASLLPIMYVTQARISSAPSILPYMLFGELIKINSFYNWVKVVYDRFKIFNTLFVQNGEKVKVAFVNDQNVLLGLVCEKNILFFSITNN
jgi:hypothetical protein